MKRDLSVENQFSVYVGLDWGTEFHRACVLNSRGEILRECRIDHSGQAITDFVRSLNEMGNGKPDHVAVAIEESAHPGPPRTRMR